MTKKIEVPSVLFMGTKKRKNYLNLSTYRNAHFILLNNAKKEFKRLVKDEVLKLGNFKKIKPKYRYYIPRKADIGNINSVVEKFFLDAIVELGIIEDDDCYRVIGGDYEFVRIDREQPRCIITIEELEK